MWVAALGSRLFLAGPSARGARGAVDAVFAMDWPADLELRSLWSSFEISPFVCKRALTERLRALPNASLRSSTRLDLATRCQRPRRRRFVENAVRLLAPPR